jgi:hypothetical protein
MIITTSNVLKNTTPTVTTGISTDLPQNLTDPDFSAIYISSDQFTLIAEFGVVGNIDHVAVAGLNIKGNGSGSSYVRVYDVNILRATINVTTNQVVVVSFTEQSFTNLRVEVVNGAGTENPIVSYISAGLSITVPNGGEQAGYNRQFLQRNVTNKTIINSEAAPITALKKKKPAKGRLNIPNVTRSFSETTWQDFLDFGIDNYFFIKEQEDVVISESSGTNESSYLCYNITGNTVRAHSQTRALNDISLSFTVFNGL